MKEFISKHKGIVILLFVALLYLVVYYLIIQKPQHNVTTIYFADRVTEAHRILVEKYNQLNAGKVKVVQIDFPNTDFSTNERKEILARSLRGEGDGIDLLAVDVIWAQRFAKWCEPLGKYFSQEELDRISKETLSSCYSNGELVAVPLDMVQAVLYYREDLLKKLPGGDKIIQRLKFPITWGEFAALKKEAPLEKPFYIFPAADFEGLICVFMEMLLSRKPDYFETTGFDFNTPEAKEVLELLVKTVNDYNLSPKIVSTFTEVPSFQYFIDNDGLFIRGWTSYDKDFTTAPYNIEKQKHLRKALLPYFSGGQPASTIGGWNLMISKFSTKKEAAVDFVKFLLREDSQEIFFSESGYFPVIKVFYEDSMYLTKYPEMHFLKTLMETGVHRPPHKDYTKYSKIMSHYFSLAIEKKISVDEALKDATKMIQAEKAQTETR